MFKKYIKRSLVLFLYITLSFFIVINIHEIGHTVAAYLLGDLSASYSLIKIRNGKLVAIGSNEYDVYMFNRWQIILVSLAGVVTTQILAYLLAFKLAKRESLNLNTFSKVFFYALLFDLIFQEWQLLITKVLMRDAICYKGVCGNDFADTVWLLAQSLEMLNVTGIFALKIASLVVVVGWVWFVMRRFRRVEAKRWIRTD